MNLKELANKALKEVKSNSPELLTAIGVSGVVILHLDSEPL